MNDIIGNKNVLLHIMVGVPGCGKSTFVDKNKKENDVVVSSDAIRKELFGDENCQDRHDLVFLTAQQRAVEALENGNNVWYDATNINRKNRNSILSVCPKFVKKIADVVWNPIGDCIKNDANRDRTVGEEVITRMIKRFEFPYYDEGFDAVIVHLPEQWDYDCSLTYMKKCLDMMNIPHDNPHHSLSIGEHCMASMNIARKNGENQRVCRVLLGHDIGKPFTKEFKNGRGEPTEIAHYFGHQSAGAWIATGFPDYSVDELYLISAHMEPYFDSKYYKSMPQYIKREVDKIHKYDALAH